MLKCAYRLVFPKAKPVTLATAHAPVGGLYVGNKFFVGGEFIPDTAMAKATAAQKAQLHWKKDLFDSDDWQPPARQTNIFDELPQEAEPIEAQGTQGDLFPVTAKEQARNAIANVAANHDMSPEAYARHDAALDAYHPHIDNIDELVEQWKKGKAGRNAAVRKLVQEHGIDGMSAGRLLERAAAKLPAVKEEPRAQEPWEMTKLKFATTDPQPEKRGFPTWGLKVGKKVNWNIRGKIIKGTIERMDPNFIDVRPDDVDPADLADFINIPRRDGGFLIHESAVRKALKEGKPVPAEVLADYPEFFENTNTEPESVADNSPEPEPPAKPTARKIPGPLKKLPDGALGNEYLVIHPDGKQERVLGRNAADAIKRAGEAKQEPEAKKPEKSTESISEPLYGLPKHPRDMTDDELDTLHRANVKKANAGQIKTNDERDQSNLVQAEWHRRYKERNEAKKKERKEARGKDREEYLAKLKELEAKGTLKDGRKVPKPGDKVFMVSPGAFGMPTFINGEVVRAKDGGLKIQVSGGGDMIGLTNVKQGLMDWTPEWTVQGDPAIAAKKQKQKEEEAAKKASEEKAGAESRKRIQESMDKAVASGNLPYSEEEAKAGRILVRHHDDGTTSEQLIVDSGKYGPLVTDFGEPEAPVTIGKPDAYTIAAETPETIKKSADGLRVAAKYSRQNEAISKKEGWDDHASRHAQEAEKLERLASEMEAKFGKVTPSADRHDAIHAELKDIYADPKFRDGDPATMNRALELEEELKIHKPAAIERAQKEIDAEKAERASLKFDNQNVGHVNHRLTDPVERQKLIDDVIANGSHRAALSRVMGGYGAVDTYLNAVKGGTPANEAIARAMGWSDYKPTAKEASSSPVRTALQDAINKASWKGITAARKALKSGDEQDVRAALEDALSQTGWEGMSKAREALKADEEPESGKGHIISEQEIRETVNKAKSPDIALADTFAKMFDDGEKIDSKQIWKIADEHHGGTRAEGKYGPSDAYDSMEAGFNKHLMGKTDPTADLAEAKEQAEEIEEKISQLPTQTNRSGEKDSHQQFSTPPHYAYAAAWLANLSPSDTVLEPSAGTACLAVQAANSGAQVYANELSPRRADFLKTLLGDDHVHIEDAEQIAAILPKKGVPAPTAILMNPPFSQTAGRMGDKKDTMTGARHIEEAMRMLAPGGRLVSIVGRGMDMTSPTFRDWFKKMQEKYNLRANIEVSGDEYTKYGTKFGTRMLVFDKTGPQQGDTVTGEADSIPDLMAKLEGVRNDRRSNQQSASEQDGGEVSSPSGSAGSNGLPVSAPVNDLVAGDDRLQGGMGTPAAGAGTPADISGSSGGDVAGQSGGVSGFVTEFAKIPQFRDILSNSMTD